MPEAPSQIAPRSDVYEHSAYSPLVGTEFRVLRGQEWVSVTLSEVRTLAGHQAVTREKFSLMFTAGEEKPLQQGMHEFEHPALGRFTLFFTPVISRDPSVRCYEAVINREV